MYSRTRKAWLTEEEEALKVLYTEEEITDPYQLALIFNKNHRSVISKLVQLKLYKKPEAESNTITTKTLLIDLERLLKIDIQGTSVHNKRNLLKIVRAVEKILNDCTCRKKDRLEDC